MSIIVICQYSIDCSYINFVLSFNITKKFLNCKTTLTVSLYNNIIEALNNHTPISDYGVHCLITYTLKLNSLKRH